MTILANGEEILAADELDRLLDSYTRRGRLTEGQLREALARLEAGGEPGLLGVDRKRAAAAIAAAIKRGGASGPGSPP